MHVDYVHILLDLLLDIALFINVSSNSIFSYPQIPLVYFFTVSESGAFAVNLIFCSCGTITCQHISVISGFL